MIAFQCETLIRRDERLVAMSEAMQPLSEEASRSIEGGIDLVIGGETLLKAQEWDDVDSLWGYLLNGAARAKQGDRFQCFFPNSPTAIRIKPVAVGQVRFEIGEEHEDFYRCVMAAEDTFNAALVQGSAAFFQWLETVSPQRSQGTWFIISFLKGQGPPPQTWTLNEL